MVVVRVDLPEDVDGGWAVLNFDQLDFEVEGCAARDDVTSSVFTVAELCNMKL